MFLNKHKKKFLLVVALSFLWPQLVWAGGDFGSKIPELNPLCWKKADCLLVETRQFIEMTSGPCQTHKGGKDGEQWGMCLPAATVTTRIGIGGVTTFLHIGDYILTVYNYAVRVAGIIGVAVIIVAGLQWLTSGGNSDMISRAQKRIFGAVIGLIIAYASYFILNNINPALVYLRLPNVWVIRPANAVPDMCSDLPEDKVLFKVAEYTDQSSPATKPLSTTKYTYKAAKEKFKNDAKYKASGHLEWFPCGRRFIVEGGGNSTCFADTCQNEGWACGPFGADVKKKYFCKKGQAVITVTHTGKRWEINPIVAKKSVRILALCQDGNMGLGTGGGSSELDDITIDNKQTFVITAENYRLDSVNESCNKNGGLAGFVIKLSMNVDTAVLPELQEHYIGKDIKDLGDKVFFTVASGISVGSGSGVMGPAIEQEYDAWNKKIDNQYLYPVDFLKKGAPVIRLTINADEIPYIKDDAQRQAAYSKYLKK